MHSPKELITRIILPESLREAIYTHCRRKANGHFLADETPDQKAFGLIGGRTNLSVLTVDLIIPLLKNARSASDHKHFMDEAMARHAIPSETSMEKRGWVADQEELAGALAQLQNKGSRLVGAYHMHRIAWDHDKTRDTPTHLDTILAKESRMFMFIVAMVDQANPRIRAFFEGAGDKEVSIESLAAPLQ